MATSAPRVAPKTVPKQVAAPEPVVETPAPKKSKKKLILLILIGLLLLGGAGFTGWYFLLGNAPAGTAAAAKKEVPKIPVFVIIEPFTVNLQSEGSDQFLQISLTLQVPDQIQEDLIKTFMPQVRNRLLFLLSSKKASEISTVEGKKKLTEDIIAAVNQPFSAKGPAQTVSNVFFTSFVIQ